MDFGIPDDIVDTILITNKKLLHFKLSPLGQILRLILVFSELSQIQVYHSLQSQFLFTAISMVRYVATERFVGIKAVATYCPTQCKCMGKP